MRIPEKDRKFIEELSSKVGDALHSNILTTYNMVFDMRERGKTDTHMSNVHFDNTLENILDAIKLLDDTYNALNSYVCPKCGKSNCMALRKEKAFCFNCETLLTLMDFK